MTRHRALLLLVLVVPLLLQAASLPHTHSGSGLFNQEHDLTLLATQAAGVSLAVAAAALLPIVVVVALSIPASPTHAVAVVADAGPRAPPVR
jgi:hypothetical protein